MNDKKSIKRLAALYDKADQEVACAYTALERAKKQRAEHRRNFLDAIANYFDEEDSEALTND